MDGKHLITFFHLCIIVISTILASCTDLTDIENDIKDLQSKVTKLEDAVSALQIAYKDGKVIKSVEAIEDNGVKGWKVTFSDDTAISLMNGEAGITPFLKIDENGYWCVSYDNTQSFEKLVDNEGIPVHAQGDEGISVRVVINDDGFYIIETYRASEPEVILSTIETAFSANKENILSSIIKDSQTDVLTLIMADGTSFNFNLDVSYPTSIVLLTNELLIGKNSTATFEFRLNPSNAVLNMNIEGDAPQLALDVVNENMTRGVATSYITVPTNYKLIKVEPSVNTRGEIKVGQYTAYVQDLGIAGDYDEGVVLVVSTRDGAGNDIQLSSSLMKISCGVGNELLAFDIPGAEVVSRGENAISVRVPYGTDVTALKATFNTISAGVYVGDQEQISGETANDYSYPVTFRVVSREGDEHNYVVTVCYSNLPIVYITMPDDAPIASKDDWVKGGTMVIGSTNNVYDAEYNEISVKGRGNSTWNYPKKPYAIKLDKKAEVLGMPEHKRWVLLANWMDKTLMRNAVAFEIAKSMEDLEWTPRGQFVEVVLNGQFLGNYYLCEQIKVDENRVDIAEMESTDIAGDALTGGYLLEFDVAYDEVNKFKTDRRNFPVNIKEPDEETLAQEQFTYIKDYVNQTEAALYAGDFVKTGIYKEYMDVNTYIDWWLVHELTQNSEPYHPKSCYMYKDRNGKLKAGPTWDFDWATFVPEKTNSFQIKNCMWYNRLFLDPSFVALVKQKWNASKARFEAISGFIDTQAILIKESAEVNSQMWPINQTVNGDETMSFEDAVARMKNVYQERLQWLDKAINAL